MVLLLVYHGILLLGYGIILGIVLFRYGISRYGIIVGCCTILGHGTILGYGIVVGYGIIVGCGIILG